MCLRLQVPASSSVRLKIAPGFPLARALVGGKLALAGLDVPAGRYAKASLTALDVWTQVQSQVVYGESVRAALAYNPELARLGRQHNNANCVALGGRMQPLEQSLQIVLAFLETPWTNEERHARRVAMLTKYEATGQL